MFMIRLAQTLPPPGTPIPTPTLPLKGRESSVNSCEKLENKTAPDYSHPYSIIWIAPIFGCGTSALVSALTPSPT